MLQFYPLFYKSKLVKLYLHNCASTFFQLYLHFTVLSLKPNCFLTPFNETFTSTKSHKTKAIFAQCANFYVTRHNLTDLNQSNAQRPSSHAYRTLSPFKTSSLLSLLIRRAEIFAFPTFDIGTQLGVQDGVLFAHRPIFHVLWQHFRLLRAKNNSKRTAKFHDWILTPTTPNSSKNTLFFW